ncbi:MAG: amidoligase family protein [Candidatus Kapaibacterium sp.]
MNAEQIIRGTGTKSQKMRDLFDLGFSRTEVAQMMGAGYGFVQNVYQAYYQTGRFQEVLESNSTFNFRFNRTFGIEIEGYNCDRDELARKLTERGIQTNHESYNHTTRRAWKVIYDGSLSGNKSFEVVSPVLKGQNGLDQLQTVCEVLEEMNAKVNKTCGLHIHIGVSDYEIEDWKRLFKNYIKMEKTVDAFMPNSRRKSNNTYTKSLVKPNYKQIIEEASNLEGLERSLLRSDRYHKINTKCFWRQKTVEFRQHSGTVDFAKISNWVKFVMRLTDYSKTSLLQSKRIDNLEFCSDELKEFYKQRTQALAS